MLNARGNAQRMHADLFTRLGQEDGGEVLALGTNGTQLKQRHVAGLPHLRRHANPQECVTARECRKK